MKATIAAPSLFKDFGGPRKTINAFAKALESPIYLFCDGVRIRDEALAVDSLIAMDSHAVRPLRRPYLIDAIREMVCDL